MCDCVVITGACETRGGRGGKINPSSSTRAHTYVFRPCRLSSSPSSPAYKASEKRGSNGCSSIAASSPASSPRPSTLTGGSNASAPRDAAPGCARWLADDRGDASTVSGGHGLLTCCNSGNSSNHPASVARGGQSVHHAPDFKRRDSAHLRATRVAPLARSLWTSRRAPHLTVVASVPFAGPSGHPAPTRPAAGECGPAIGGAA